MSHKHSRDTKNDEDDDQDLDFKGNKSPLKKESKIPKPNKDLKEVHTEERGEKLVKVKDVKLVKGKDIKQSDPPVDLPVHEVVHPNDYLAITQENKIRELNAKVIDLESEIQELTSRVSKTNNQELQNKINDLETQLIKTKDEILMHNKQVQGFMEDGIRSIKNQKEQIDNSQNILEQIKDEMIMQHHLIKKRDELVEKAQQEVDEANQVSTKTKIKNVELEHEIEKLMTKIERMHEERKHLESVVVDEQTKSDQIYKKNLLIDELNKDMLEMNIEDLCKFVNQSLYECVHGIRRSNIKEIVKVGDQVLDTLKDQGLMEPVKEIESIMRQFEFLREKPKTIPKENDKNENDKSDNKNKDKNSNEDSDNKNSKGDHENKDKNKEKEDAAHKKKREKEEAALQKQKEKEEAAIKKQKENEAKEKARFKRMVENAKKYNPVLKRLMNCSQLKAKGKDGKWTTKFSFSKSIAKAVVKVAGHEGKHVSTDAEVRKMVKRLDYLEERNQELEVKQKHYEDLLATVSISILNYVSKVHNDIQEVSDDYKGIVNFDDNEMLNKIKEVQHKRENGLKEESDKDIIKRIKKENMDLLQQLSHCKLHLNEMEVENNKNIRKEKMLRDNITEMKISIDEMQQRFEARIGEYKTQIHLKEEYITNLKDQIRFQKKVITEQDQKIVLSLNTDDSNKIKLKESKAYQELLNQKIREYGDLVNQLNKQLKDLTDERNSLIDQNKDQRQKLDQFKMKMKTLEELYYKVDQKLMKENSKYLKLVDVHEELKKKHSRSLEFMKKMKEDHDELLNEYSKMEINIDPNQLKKSAKFKKEGNAMIQEVEEIPAEENQEENQEENHEEYQENNQEVYEGEGQGEGEGEGEIE